MQGGGGTGIGTDTQLRQDDCKTIGERLVIGLGGAACWFYVGVRWALNAGDWYVLPQVPPQIVIPCLALTALSAVFAARQVHWAVS